MISQKNKDILFWKILTRQIVRYRYRLYLFVIIALLALLLHFVPYTNLIFSSSIVLQTDIFLLCIFLPFKPKDTIKFSLIIFLLMMVLSLLDYQLIVQYLGVLVYFLIIKGAAQLFYEYKGK